VIDEHNAKISTSERKVITNKNVLEQNLF